MVAICHFDADWQNAGNVSRHRVSTSIRLRSIHASRLLPLAPRSIAMNQLFAKSEACSHQLRWQSACQRWKRELSVPARLEFHAVAIAPVSHTDGDSTDQVAPTSGHHAYCRAMVVTFDIRAPKKASCSALFVVRHWHCACTLIFAARRQAFRGRNGLRSQPVRSARKRKTRAAHFRCWWPVSALAHLLDL